jgi:hypothetical protein
MPNQHRWPQRNLRLDTPLWERTKEYAVRTGQTVTAVITKAVTEYLDRHDREEQQ